MTQVQAGSFNNLQGEGGATDVPESALTKSRIIAEHNIQDTARQQNVNVDDVVTGIMADNVSDLIDFILNQGESVNTDDATGIALHATLLRANQIAIVAGVLGCSDYNALLHIENSESNYVRLNTPDAAHVLFPDVMAAMKIALDYAADCDTEKGGSGRMSDIVQNVIALSDYYNSAGSADNFINNRANDFDFDDGDDPSQAITDTAAMDEVDYPTASPASIGASLASIPGVETDPGIIAPQQMSGVAAEFPSISNTASNMPQAGATTSAGGVLNSISSLLTGITQVSNQVTTAANAAGGAAGAVKAAATQVGANAIATYVKNNAGTILFVVFIIIVIIMAIVYASKHRHK